MISKAMIQLEIAMLSVIKNALTLKNMSLLTFFYNVLDTDATAGINQTNPFIPKYLKVTSSLRTKALMLVFLLATKLVLTNVAKGL